MHKYLMLVVAQKIITEKSIIVSYILEKANEA